MGTEARDGRRALSQPQQSEREISGLVPILGKGVDQSARNQYGGHQEQKPAGLGNPSKRCL